MWFYTCLCVGAVFISDNAIFRVNNNIGSHAYKPVYGMGAVIFWRPLPNKDLSILVKVVKSSCMQWLFNVYVT